MIPLSFHSRKVEGRLQLKGRVPKRPPGGATRARRRAGGALPFTEEMGGSTPRGLRGAVPPSGSLSLNVRVMKSEISPNRAKRFEFGQIERKDSISA